MNTYIILPMYLGSIVNEILQEKHGLPAAKYDFNKQGYVFPSEQLNKIVRLDVNNPVSGALVGIEKLPALKYLFVRSHPKKRTEHIHPKEIASIDDKDITCIEKCAGLEALVLEKQAKITDMDVTNLKNLNNLVFINNQSLETVSGLKHLSNLNFFDCYGNNELKNIDGLDNLISGGQISELNLDALLFPAAVGYSASRGTYNQNAINAIANIPAVKWVERFGASRKISISNNDMIKVHNKACEILNGIVRKISNPVEKIVAIEKYLAENVKYDDDSIKNGSHTHAVNKMVVGPSHGANGLYNCLMLNKCVCEGYTRGEQYLLSLCGISSSNVACTAHADIFGFSDSGRQGQTMFTELPRNGYHSIVRILTSDGYLYSDPCWNACVYETGRQDLPYSLLTKEEISRDHTLLYGEIDISNAHNVDRKRINEMYETATRIVNNRTHDNNKPEFMQIVAGAGMEYS